MVSPRAVDFKLNGLGSVKFRFRNDVATGLKVASRMMADDEN
jgi:hypothetical protein